MLFSTCSDRYPDPCPCAQCATTGVIELPRSRGVGPVVFPQQDVRCPAWCVGGTHSEGAEDELLHFSSSRIFPLDILVSWPLLRHVECVVTKWSSVLQPGSVWVALSLVQHGTECARIDIAAQQIEPLLAAVESIGKLYTPFGVSTE